MERDRGKLLLLGLMMTASVQAQTDLSYGFDHPQDSARTKVWWFHGETIGTHEGITADLEAFKEQGVGGVVYYDQVHGKGEDAFKVFSPEWWDELIFSSQESKRIGLGFECNASNGYVAGGRWITPDKSMQRLATTELIVEGGKDLRVQMPMVKTPGNWYRDVALIALPYDEQLMGDSRNVISADSVWKLSDSRQTTTIDMDFGRVFTARSITYVVGGRAKARTSSMQVPPFSPRVIDMRKGKKTKWDFFGCGYRQLPPIGELQVSDDGITYRTVCQLRPKYQNLGGVKEQTMSFAATRGRYFRIQLHDWGTGNPADENLKFGNVVLSARASVDAWQEKASLISEIIEGDHTPRYAAGELVDFSQAIDLSASIDEKGCLTWRHAPKGKWLLLRFFSMSTGGHTKHGRAEALGLECDKLSVEGARLQWQSYVKPIIDSIRIHNGLLTGICMDSHEAGPQNWTIGLEEEFMRLRGYDMKKYLPVMAGLVVGSAEESDKFLYDLRHTINDLITDKYFGEFNRLCRSEGLVLTAQAIGGALCMAGDAISVKRPVDKPQAEFWGYQTEGNYDIKDCSSAAHLYGKQIASGEAFTDITYKETLADIKNLADYAYAYGINEFVVCAVAYQPWVRTNGPLRINTANGRQYVLNRLNTFWPMSRGFWDYQARCSWMLRQGKPVSDFCLYLGDNIPVRILSHKLPEIPKGFDFDAFTTDALLNRMTAKDGRVTLPDGISYRMVILPVDGQLTNEAKQQIENFRQAGVLVYDPQTDNRTLVQAIQEAGIKPDVEAPAIPNLYFCHRRTAKEDIYFLNNQSDQTVSDNFLFHVSRSSAALWNPVTGERIPLKVKHIADRTAIDLRFAPRESYFVVLQDEMMDYQEALTAEVEVSEVLPLHSSWTLSFNPEMGGPLEQKTVEGLGDWTKHSDPQVKYYSGTVVAKTIFETVKSDGKCTYRLNIPLLNTAAEVIVNGRSAGILWCAPYDIDITRFVKRGQNHLELRIANSLWNRLVGDASLPEQERVTWQTHPLATSSDTLVPSGVAGDITISMYNN